MREAREIAGILQTPIAQLTLKEALDFVEFMQAATPEQLKELGIPDLDKD